MLFSYVFQFSDRSCMYVMLKDKKQKLYSWHESERDKKSAALLKDHVVNLNNNFPCYLQ